MLMEREIDEHAREIADAVARAGVGVRARRRRRAAMDGADRARARALLLFMEFWAYGVRDARMRPKVAARFAQMRAHAHRADRRRHARVRPRAAIPAEQLAIAIDALADGIARQKLADPGAVPGRADGQGAVAAARRPLRGPAGGTDTRSGAVNSRRASVGASRCERRAQRPLGARRARARRAVSRRSDARCSGSGSSSSPATGRPAAATIARAASRSRRCRWPISAACSRFAAPARGDVLPRAAPRRRPRGTRAPPRRAARRVGDVLEHVREDAELECAVRRRQVPRRSTRPVDRRPRPRAISTAASVISTPASRAAESAAVQLSRAARRRRSRPRACSPGSRRAAAAQRDHVVGLADRAERAPARVQRGLLAGRASRRSS